MEQRKKKEVPPFTQPGGLARGGEGCLRENLRRPRYRKSIVSSWPASGRRQKRENCAVWLGPHRGGQAQQRQMASRRDSHRPVSYGGFADLH